MDAKQMYAAARVINRKGLTGAAGTVIGVMIAIIVIVAVALPVVSDVVSSANQTGTTATILNLLPLFLGLAALVIVAALFS